MEEAKQTLLGANLDELKAIAKGLALPTFVGKQIADWIYGKCVTSIDQMQNISKIAIAKLNEKYSIGCSNPVMVQESKDGTKKYLFRTLSGQFVETVYIPDGKRATLCVSCQVGCKMKCAFCMTGRQGFVESLTTADILNQIYALPERDKLTNVVFMGQGEPFDNLDNVLRATQILTADWGFAWSPKRITVSSVGLRKGLKRFLDESKCNIAISLHHPLPEQRAELMPAEKAFPIKEVVDVLRQYDFCRKTKSDAPKQRRLTFEYIVFKGVNDSLRHAEALLYLLHGLDCRVNLIRFHNIPDTPLEGASDSTMTRFRDYLTSHGIYTTIRASRGQDIFAACGLLTTEKAAEARKTI